MKKACFIHFLVLISKFESWSQIKSSDKSFSFTPKAPSQAIFNSFIVKELCYNLFLGAPPPQVPPGGGPVPSAAAVGGPPRGIPPPMRPPGPPGGNDNLIEQKSTYILLIMFRLAYHNFCILPLGLLFSKHY